MVAGPTPEAAVFPVEEYSINGARCAALKAQGVSHCFERFADPVGRFFVKEDITGFGGVIVKGTPHLEAVEIRCFTGFLNVHAKFRDIQEKLEQVLILGIPALHSEG